MNLIDKNKEKIISLYEIIPQHQNKNTWFKIVKPEQPIKKITNTNHKPIIELKSELIIESKIEIPKYIEKNLTFEDAFPFPEYREYQENVIQKIYDAFNEDKVVLLTAPTGFGKSPVAVAISRLFPNTFYLTPQIKLQEQLEKDFPEYLQLVKGRSNFTCKILSDYNCNEGQCIQDKNYKCETQCPYKIQRDIAFAAPTMLSNVAYFTLYQKYALPEQKQYRNTLIIDEAHSIINLMQSEINITIHEKAVSSIPILNSIQEYANWLTLEIPKIQYKIDKLEIQQSIIFIVEEKKKILKRIRYLEHVIQNINNFIEDYQTHPWVFQIDNKNIFNKKIVLQPLTVERFMPKYLWQYTNNILLMSASIINPESFLQEAGLKGRKYEVINIPSTFPVKNRLIKYIPIGNMNYKSKIETIPKIADAISKIIESHKEQKGIVHCHSYELAQYLYNKLSLNPIFENRLVLQKENNEKREISLDKWIQSTNKIFLSVNYTDGLDLKDSLCRWQITAKIPFPDSEHDARIKERIQRKEWMWYNSQAIATLIQTAGRAVRSKTDWATYYILDAGFTSLYLYNNKLFPKFFTEALVLPEIPRRT